MSIPGFLRVGQIRVFGSDSFLTALISDMTHNLICLGTLEANGCRYSAENGVLKVMKGTMVLMMGFRQRSLYLIDGTIVTGSAAVCTTSTDVNTTRL